MKKLFHLSNTNLNNKILTPRIPDNRFTKMGIENKSIARVCFSDNINGCLLAMGENAEDKVFFVHEPINYDLKIISNKEIIKNNYVPDADITGEIWVTVPVKLKYLYKIKIFGAIEESILYKDSLGNIYKEYKWNWKII